MLRDRQLEEQRPIKGGLASPFDLLYASFAVYSRSFWRLVAIAGMGWLLSNVLLLSLSVPLAFESVVMWECCGFAAVKRPWQPEC